ncbi:MAG: NDP-sugar synthase [Deltaproteobacteria bacterium]|nr:MAG: NDP-sugar synthase [Deltaproteobacteria bacterium]
MKAAILAAGLGTRLRPLTELVPKTLLPILNRPLLGLLLAQLEDAGFLQAAVNTHHLGEQVQRFLASQPWSLNLSISPEPELLGTGGGLRQLGEILRAGTFLAVNGDILTDLDLAAVYRSHQPEAMTTLVLQDFPAFNNVWIDAQGRLAGVGDRPGTAAGPPLAYTGVQVVGRKMLDYLPPAGYYDLVAAWRQALAAGERIDTLVVSGHFWQDVGSLQGYLVAHCRLLNGEGASLARFLPPLTDPLLGPRAILGQGAECRGCVCLGEGAQVGERAILKNTVVGEGARIGPGVRLEGCLVAPGARVTESAWNRIMMGNENDQ